MKVSNLTLPLLASPSLLFSVWRPTSREWLHRPMESALAARPAERKKFIGASKWKMRLTLGSRARYLTNMS